MYFPRTTGPSSRCGQQPALTTKAGVTDSPTKTLTRCATRHPCPRGSDPSPPLKCEVLRHSGAPHPPPLLPPAWWALQHAHSCHDEQRGHSPVQAAVGAHPLVDAGGDKGGKHRQHRRPQLHERHGSPKVGVPERVGDGGGKAGEEGTEARTWVGCHTHTHRGRGGARGRGKGGNNKTPSQASAAVKQQGGNG
jgi:hypothetical protein